MKKLTHFLNSVAMFDKTSISHYQRVFFIIIYELPVISSLMNYWLSLLINYVNTIFHLSFDNELINRDKLWFALLDQLYDSLLLTNLCTTGYPSFDHDSSQFRGCSMSSRPFIQETATSCGVMFSALLRCAVNMGHWP